MEMTLKILPSLKKFPEILYINHCFIVYDLARKHVLMILKHLQMAGGNM